MGWRGVSKAEESGGGDLAGALASRTTPVDPQVQPAGWEGGAWNSEPRA